jgi:hypothetical protein
MKRKRPAAATNPNCRKKYKSSETVKDGDSSDEEHKHRDEEQGGDVDEFSAPAAAQATNQPSISDMANTSGLQLPDSDFPHSNDLDVLGSNINGPREPDVSVPLFDCDAALAALDMLFGPST